MGLAQEWRLFLCAVQFLTRLPTPRLPGFESSWIGRSTRYFPLVGQVVGALCAAVLLVTHRLWGGTIAALLAVGAGIWITGAFHEDGLADTADGLGGGVTPEVRLAIMKDSRVGTYGLLALGLVTGLRVAALAGAPPWRAAVALLAAHGAGRAAAVVVMAAQPYVGVAASAKADASPQGVEPAAVLMAVFLSFWPFALFDVRAGAFGLALGALAAAGVAGLAWRLIGGRTGDVLGAVEQAMEAGVLLGASVVFR